MDREIRKKNNVIALSNTILFLFLFHFICSNSAVCMLNVPINQFLFSIQRFDYIIR